MSLRKILITIAVAWLAFITLIHASINLHAFRAKETTVGQNKFRIGFLPVTCHLTCPVTDINCDPVPREPGTILLPRSNEVL